MHYNGTPRTDAFTEGCRDLIRSLSYESIVACTVYVPPMLFMIGPAAIMTGHPLVLIAFHSLLGFGMSSTIHRMGHRLLTALPKAPQNIPLSPRRCLPIQLTLSQFLWMLETSVAIGVFCAIFGHRLLHENPAASGLLFVLGLALYFLPVYLAKLWSHRYYPTLALLGPTEDVIRKSFPGLRSFLR